MSTAKNETKRNDSVEIEIAFVVLGKKWFVYESESIKKKKLDTEQAVNDRLNDLNFFNQCNEYIDQSIQFISKSLWFLRNSEKKT